MIDLSKEIEDALDDFSDRIEPIQKKLYNKVAAMLKELSLDDEGMIKITSANISIINDVKGVLQNVVNDPAYHKAVASINSALGDITDLQTNYFEGVDPDFVIPTVMTAVQEQAFDETISSLTEAGMDVNVAEAATDIVSSSIMEGGSFADMQDSMKDFIMGNDDIDGKLESYTHQIVSDSMHTTSRKYESLAADKLGLQWYMYVGSQKDTSRPLCIALLKKKYIHESELGKIARGIVNDIQVSTSGMMEDTNAENFVDRCGGWQCSHHCMPVSEEMIPSALRRKFAPDDDTEPDEDEIDDSIPRHDD